MTAALLALTGLLVLVCLHLWARAQAAELNLTLERERAESARCQARAADERVTTTVRDTLALLEAAETRAKEERIALTDTLKELVIGPAAVELGRLHVSEDDEVRAAALASAEEAERRIAQAEAAMDAGIPVTIP